MEHQIVAFGREGGNPSEGRLAIRDSWPDMVGTGRPAFPVVAQDSDSLGFLVNHNRDPYPMFFVSTVSKGLSRAVSLLFATLARISISVAVKGLKTIGCKYRM